MEVTDRPKTTMTNVGRVCGKCGSKIFADAPQGFCSLCLFKTGLGALPNEDDELLGLSAARMPTEFGDYELLKEIGRGGQRSEEHTSELQSLRHLVCRLLLEKKKRKIRQ